LNKYTINFSKESKNDILKIIEYILVELKQPVLSRDYYNLFMTEISELNMFPKRNPIVEGKTLDGVERRKLLIKNYIVFYLVDDIKNIVYIERIVYGASDWIKNI